MLKACCGNSHFELTESNTCHVTELFLLFIGDQITDLIVLSHWYKYGYNTWFICGSTVVGASWIMQWLYSTWNCNQYLQNLLKRRRLSCDHMSSPQCCGSSLTKTLFASTFNPRASDHDAHHTRAAHIDQWKKSVYSEDGDDDDVDSLLDLVYNHHPRTCHRYTIYTFGCFLFKCFVWHLVCNGGIIELYLTNISRHRNKLIGSFIDLCHLHCISQSIAMTALVLLFGFNHLYFTDFKSKHHIDNNAEYLSIMLVHYMSLLLSFLCACIFTVNFEKFRLIPLYHVGSVQFSRHNIVAIYILCTGDLLLRFVPLCFFWSFYDLVWHDMQSGSVYFVISTVCILLSALLCFMYHLLCWYRWGFLRRECWIYEHYPFLSYQILNPIVNVLEITPVLGSFLRQILFVYASLLVSNISVMGYVYFRPVVTVKYADCQFITKCIRSECFIRHCLGIIILTMVLCEGKRYQNTERLPDSMSIALHLDIIILILSVLFLVMNVILVHNLSDTPLIHIDLFRVDGSCKKKIYSAPRKPVYVCYKEESFSTDESDDIEAQENTARNSYSKVSIMDPDEHRDYSAKDVYKPSKIHWMLRCLIKIHFNYYDTKHRKGDGMEPWSRFAIEAKWELDPLGFWKRQAKHIKKRHKKKERVIFEEDMFCPQEMKKDPFYKQYERMSGYEEKRRRRVSRKFMSHFVSYSWNKLKWNNVYIHLKHDQDVNAMCDNPSKQGRTYHITVSPPLSGLQQNVKLRRLSVASQSATDAMDDDDDEEKKWYSGLRITREGGSYSLIPSVSASQENSKGKCNKEVVKWHQKDQKQHSSLSKSTLSKSIPEYEELDGTGTS